MWPPKAVWRIPEVEEAMYEPLSGGSMSEKRDDTEADGSDDVKPKLSWEHKTEFGINTKMKEILKLTLSAAQAERDRLKKKLDKLQYGG
jgi:hypothetical protein